MCGSGGGCGGGVGNGSSDGGDGNGGSGNDGGDACVMVAVTLSTRLYRTPCTVTLCSSSRTRGVRVVIQYNRNN